MEVKLSSSTVQLHLQLHISSALDPLVFYLRSVCAFWVREKEMDYHRLSRRELQALCKRNKIKANMTNVAMADALKSLQKVEDVDDILLTHRGQDEEQQKEKLQTSRLKQISLKDLMVKSPKVSRRQRTPSARKSMVEQMEIDGMPLISIPNTPEVKESDICKKLMARREGKENKEEDDSMEKTKSSGMVTLAYSRRPKMAVAAGPAIVQGNNVEEPLETIVRGSNSGLVAEISCEKITVGVDNVVGQESGISIELPSDSSDMCVEDHQLSADLQGIANSPVKGLILSCRSSGNKKMGDGSSVHTKLKTFSEELTSSEIHQFLPVVGAPSSVVIPALRNTDEKLVEVCTESVPSQSLFDKQLIVGTETSDKIPSSSLLTLQKDPETSDKIPSSSQLAFQKDPPNSDLLNVRNIIEDGRNNSREAAIGRGTVPELSSVGELSTTIEMDGDREKESDHLNLCDVGIRESNEEIKIGKGFYSSPLKTPVNFSNHVGVEKSIDDELCNEVPEREVCICSSPPVQITVNESDETSKFAEKQEASDEKVSYEWQRTEGQQTSPTSVKILESQAISPGVIEESDSAMDPSAIFDDIVNPIRIEESDCNTNPVGIEEYSDLMNSVGTEEPMYIEQDLKQNVDNPAFMKLKNKSLRQLRKVYRKKLISLKRENNTGVSHELGIKQINAFHKDEIFPMTTTTTTTTVTTAATTTSTTTTTTKTTDDLPSTPISRSPNNSSSMSLGKLKSNCKKMISESNIDSHGGSLYKRVSESNLNGYGCVRKPQINKDASRAKTVSTVTTTTTTTVTTITDADANSGYRDMSLRKLKSCYKNSVSASKTNIDDKSRHWARRLALASQRLDVCFELYDLMFSPGFTERLQNKQLNNHSSIR